MSWLIGIVCVVAYIVVVLLLTGIARSADRQVELMRIALPELGDPPKYDPTMVPSISHRIEAALDAEFPDGRPETVSPEAMESVLNRLRDLGADVGNDPKQPASATASAVVQMRRPDGKEPERSDHPEAS